MKVYLERKDIPYYCTKCPFVNNNDNCIIQDDDAYIDTETWDEMYVGCPIRSVEDYGKERKENDNAKEM